MAKEIRYLKSFYWKDYCDTVGLSSSPSALPVIMPTDRGGVSAAWVAFKSPRLAAIHDLLGQWSPWMVLAWLYW